MRKLLKRWYVWLGLVLLLGFAGSVALIYANPGRITQANFDRICQGMAMEDVYHILGKDCLASPRMYEGLCPFQTFMWRDGPNWITITTAHEPVMFKASHFATVPETLAWYAKKAAAKIGIKWD
jgi:hypothetical protein